MCGSGTLAIEAALIGLNRAPGLLRSNFGFMHIKGFNEALWNEVREKAKKQAEKGLVRQDHRHGHQPDAVEAARKNAATAGVEHLIEFGVCDFADTPLPTAAALSC